MTYSEFNLLSAKETFNLTFIENKNLFDHVEEIEPSPFLQQLLANYYPLATAINTEKARSELIIAPVLAELKSRSARVSLFSGRRFDVDPGRGLAGFCDFLICASPEQYEITAPVITVVEAKNENINGGLGQCIATMVAAQMFNQSQDAICGVVTTGSIWKFLNLTAAEVTIDSAEYYIGQVGKILGIMSGFFAQ